MERFADGLANQDLHAAYKLAEQDLSAAYKAAWNEFSKAALATNKAYEAAGYGADEAEYEAWKARNTAARPAATLTVKAVVAKAKHAEAAAGAAYYAVETTNALCNPGYGGYNLEVAFSAEAQSLPAEDTDWAANESNLDCILPPRIQGLFPIHVKGLASTIYEMRDWLLMPILADALEEFGQTEMATHCRQPIHAKGCHVLDSIIGR